MTGRHDATVHSVHYPVANRYIRTILSFLWLSEGSQIIQPPACVGTTAISLFKKAIVFKNLLFYTYRDIAVYATF